MRAAQDIKKTGSFDGLASAASFSEINDVMVRG
jgi:hypothetical protein